jgi:chemotaxis protein CheD
VIPNSGSLRIKRVAELAVNEVIGRTSLVVDIADLAVSKDPRAVLITYSLGSCIGVTLWDPVARVAGLLHYMLPESNISPEKAKTSPAMFCDTGVPRLFKAAYDLGAVKRRLVVKVAGGSQLLDEHGTFNIGKRNYLAIRKIFWKNGILIDAESVGGSVSRTVRIEVATGAVTVKTRGQEVPL